MKQGIIISLGVVISVVAFLWIEKQLSDAHYAERLKARQQEYAVYTSGRHIEEKLVAYNQFCRIKIDELRNRLCTPLGIGKLAREKQMKEFIDRCSAGDYGTDPAGTAARIITLIHNAYPKADANGIYDRLASRINEQRDEITLGRLFLAVHLQQYENWRKSDKVTKLHSEFDLPSSRLIAVTGDDKVVQGQEALDSMIVLAHQSTLVDEMQPILAAQAAGREASKTDGDFLMATPRRANQPPVADPPADPPAPVPPMQGPPPIDSELPGNPNAHRIPIVPKKDAPTPAKNK